MMELFVICLAAFVIGTVRAICAGLDQMPDVHQMGLTPEARRVEAFLTEMRKQEEAGHAWMG